MGSAALETLVTDAVVDVEDVHARPVSPEARAADGPLLVAHADGKGVPMDRRELRLDRPLRPLTPLVP